MQSHHIMELLSTRGHDVTVIHFPASWTASQGRNILQRTKIEKGSRIYPCSKVKLVTPGLVHIKHLDRATAQVTQANAIAAEMKDRDVVVLYGIPQNGIETLISCRALKKPLVFHSFDILHKMVTRRINQGITWWLERLIYPRANRVVAISPALMEYAYRIGVKKENISFLPPGVDTLKFSPGIDSKAAKDSLGIDKDDLIVLYSGHLYDFSGVDMVIKAMPELLKVEPRLRLLVVGDGSQSTLLRLLISQFGLKEKVTLTGRMPFEMMPSILCAADICINPYQNDVRALYSFPSKVIEYIASGRPVIMTRLPGFGSVFPPESGVTLAKSEDFISELHKLLRDPDLRRESGLAARKLAEEKFSFEKVVREMESILLSAFTPVPH